ncbi:MAG: DUF262 domain-containing protein [Saprospiraceae bacterium]
MTQEERIKYWSNRLLDCLLEYRKQHPSFTFALRQRNKYGRLDAGQWFQGDNFYIFVGFTQRGDEDNKTKSVGLVFADLGDTSASCHVEIIFRTEPVAPLVAMYRHIVNTETGYYKPNQPYYDGYKYFKDYPDGDPVKNLETFLETDWKVITKEVDTRYLGNEFYVPEVDFINHLRRIEALRGNPLPTLPDGENDLPPQTDQENQADHEGETEEPRQQRDIEQIDESSTPNGTTSATEIKNPFDAAKIDIRGQSLSLDLLVKRIKTERVNLYPEYQRLPELWKPDRMSRLIESLLIRIPLPVFYFDGSSDTWEVVDGLQRLSTLKQFMVDKGDKALRLTGLEYLKEYNGMTFDELPPFLQSRIEETQLMIYVINPGTPEEIKFNIFKRINTGGLVLTAQEIRNALNQGIPAQTVRQMAGYEVFKKATGYKIPTDRMEDCDFVTRFIGFYHEYRNYQPDLDSWLNNGLARLKTMSESDRETMKSDFKKSMLAMHDIFGDDAFRKRYNEHDRRKPINKALFDSWAVNMAHLSTDEINKLKRRKKRLMDGFIRIMNDEEFDIAISRSTGDAQSVRRRFEKIADLIKQTLQD